MKPFNRDLYNGKNAIYRNGEKPDEVIWFKDGTIVSRKGHISYRHCEDGRYSKKHEFIIDLFLEDEEMYVLMLNEETRELFNDFAHPMQRIRDQLTSNDGKIYKLVPYEPEKG